MFLCSSVVPSTRKDLAVEQPPDKIVGEENRSVGWEGWEDEIRRRWINVQQRSRKRDVVRIDVFDLGFHPSRAVHPRQHALMGCSKRWT